MKTKRTERGNYIGYYAPPGKPLRSIHTAPQPTPTLALQALSALLTQLGETHHEQTTFHPARDAAAPALRAQSLPRPLVQR
ncbi:MAG: hypothetical protein JWP57_4653 [Spirosoma sp.]|nr:hypothetical protein [Spirosoma sp.]